MGGDLIGKVVTVQRARKGLRRLRLEEGYRGKGGSVSIDNADAQISAGSDAFNGTVVKKRVDEPPGAPCGEKICITNYRVVQSYDRFHFFIPFLCQIVYTH